MDPIGGEPSSKRLRPGDEEEEEEEVITLSSDSEGEEEQEVTLSSDSEPEVEEVKVVKNEVNEDEEEEDDRAEEDAEPQNGVEEVEGECEEEEEDGAYDAALLYEKEASEHPFLKEDVKRAAKDHPHLERDLCIPSVQFGPSDNEGMCSVVMTINLTRVPETIRFLWELGDAMTVSIIIDDIHKEQFRTSERRPNVLARLGSDKPSKFPVGECLINVVKFFITHWYTLTDNYSPEQHLDLSFQHGSFFSILYGKMAERFERLADFCMVCGNHLYAGGPLPTICYGELCQYQYQELGLLEGLTTPRVSAPVLALLLMTFNAAANSPRWRDILTPAPSTRDRSRLTYELQKLYRTSDRKWEFVEGQFDIHSSLGTVMPCAKLFMQSSAHYREFKKAWPSVAQFVEWLVISNQTYLELVPNYLQVDFLKSAYQFLFVADSPNKQGEFEQLVAHNGGRTRYLFHGSKQENWHSIIRSGLKNMSGTKYQLVGAVHGAGIYLSNILATSFGYCTSFNDRSVSDSCVANRCCMNGIQDGGLTLLAVVEVVDTPAAFRYDHNSIVVVTDEKWCSIRMLVAYTGNRHSCPHVDLNTITPASRKKIQDVVDMFRTANIVQRAMHA